MESVYDYESVRPGQVNSLVKNTETLCDAGTTGRNSTVEEPDYLAVLRDYQTTAKKVSTTAFDFADSGTCTFACLYLHDLTADA